MRPLLLGLALLACGTIASAQPVEGVTPRFHGFLDVLPARGKIIDTETNFATVRVRRWRLFLRISESNGIFPDQEAVLIALGDDNFFLAAGSLKRSRNGKVFSFRVPRKDLTRGIQKLRLVARSDGTYGVSFVLVGLVASKVPACLPTAVIVGDDDGFRGVELTRPKDSARLLRIPGPCEGPGTWPWL